VERAMGGVAARVGMGPRLGRARDVNIKMHLESKLNEALYF
jgi:hypothetical protein